MDNMLNVVKDAKIFDTQGIYIFSEDESRWGNLDALEVLFMVTNDEEVVRGLQFYINYMAEEKLLEIVACKKLSPLCFELELYVQEEDGSKVLIKNYLHRLIKLQEKIDQSREEYEDEPELVLTQYH